jgi:hypothetical protein
MQYWNCCYASKYTYKYGAQGVTLCVIKKGGGLWRREGGVLVWGHRQCKCRTILGERQGPGCAYKPLQLPHGHKTNGRYTWAAPKYPHMRASLGQSEHCHAQGGGGEGGGSQTPRQNRKNRQKYVARQALTWGKVKASRVGINKMRWNGSQI